MSDHFFHYNQITITPKLKMKYSFLIVCILFLISFFGCTTKMEHVKCPGFSFDSLGVDISYFNKALYYSNGKDTIRLNCVQLDCSRPHEFDRGGGYVMQCIPRFSVKYRNLAENEEMKLYVSSSEQSECMNLDVCFGNGRTTVCLDSIGPSQRAKVPIKELDNIQRSEQTKLTGFISFDLENYRIVSLEKANHERWNLIRIE